MILVNFKKNPENLLRLCIALVFISAGTYRIFNPEAAMLELNNLYLPTFLSWFLIFFEIIGGGYLLFKGKYWRKVALVFVLFLFLALINAWRVNWRYLLDNIGELFIFNKTPTDFFLHFVFLIILLSFFLKPD